MMEHIELWTVIAALWFTQLKILFDMRDIKSVIIIKKKAVVKTE